MRTPQLADNLRRAVLQAAIEGKLNDRTSEDARDLLTAIQTEKTAQQKTGKQKKKAYWTKWRLKSAVSLML